MWLRGCVVAVGLCGVVICCVGVQCIHLPNGAGRLTLYLSNPSGSSLISFTANSARHAVSSLPGMSDRAKVRVVFLSASIFMSISNCNGKRAKVL